MSDEKSFKDVLGVEVESAEDGRARLTLEASADHLNEGGTVHGGVLASLVDMAMGEAVRSGLGEGSDQPVPATSQLTVTYLRPGKPGALTVTAEVSKQGDNLTICEADVEQDGKVLVHALATFALLHG
jgi:uncharacterized protein (TIGR00369 family)